MTCLVLPDADLGGIVVKRAHTHHKLMVNHQAHHPIPQADCFGAAGLGEWREFTSANNMLIPVWPHPSYYIGTPEPATWALLLIGFVMSVYWGKRRKV